MILGRTNSLPSNDADPDVNGYAMDDMDRSSSSGGEPPGPRQRNIYALTFPLPKTFTFWNSPAMLEVERAKSGQAGLFSGFPAFYYDY